MSRSSNSLRVSDVVTTAIKLKYSASFSGAALSANGITVFTGVNGVITITGSIPQDTLNYRSIRQLYYSNYLTGSYPVSASSFDNSLQSTAASGTLDADVRYFPTESGATIQVLSIPRGVYGQQISRRSLSIVGQNNETYQDDGNGNLYAVTSGTGYYDLPAYYDLPEYYDDTNIDSPKIGNVIYGQGMVIITNPAYQSIFL